MILTEWGKQLTSMQSFLLYHKLYINRAGTPKKILASIKFAKTKEESINMQQGAVLQLHQEQSVLDVSNSNWNKCLE